MVAKQEPFDALLSWLDPNRESAGKRYEIIRAGLIRILVSQGFNDAEDLADLTINRVIDRLPDIVEGYVGEPARYFQGVVRNVIREARRRKEIATDNIPELLSYTARTSDTHDCLLNCLKQIANNRRELILEYYLYEGRDKIAHHREMAHELDLTEGALRTQAHKIRVSLEKCVTKCVGEKSGKQNRSWRPLSRGRQITDSIHLERQP